LQLGADCRGRMELVELDATMSVRRSQRRDLAPNVLEPNETIHETSRRRLDEHGIVHRDAARFHGGPVDAETTLTISGHRAQDLRVALRRHGVDRDDDAAPIALVHTHAQRADAQDAAEPSVLRERLLVRRLHEDVRSKALDLERDADRLAEAGN